MRAARPSADQLLLRPSAPACIAHGRSPTARSPHDYRPNEFVTSDFIFEGLVAWDGENPAGTDGTVGTEDDYVVPSLATSWTTSISATNQYTITFKLRTGVTFHDDSPWNAAAAVANFEQIMGGTGVLGSNKALRGFHDWLGFTQYLDAWEAVDDMTFSLIFTNYYEAALRELATIRPFRMTSVATLPDLTKFELSALPERNGAIRNPWPPRCAARGLQCYMFRGVSAPIGTGPYKVVDKLLSSGRRTPAADFNATCYSGTGCNYQAGEYVQEILFTKFAGSWKSPTYDNVILRAYPSQKAVSDALIDGSLDIAYGVNTLSAAGLISLATPEGAPHVVAHQAATDVNTRNIAINSGTIYDINMRKFILGVLAASRQALYDGELAAERPMDTLFAPNAPHCGVLNTLSTPAAVAASGTGITSANFTTPLRLLYRAYEPHSVIIAAEVQAALFAAGIPVQPLATRTRDEYNNFNCDYKAAFSYGGDPLYGQAMSYGGELIFKQEHQDDPHKCNDTDHGDAHLDCLASVHTWDLSITQTWGPPYDPTSKLWDMTHNWCSGESDRPAVQNMDSMTITQFTTAVRGLSNIQDKSARETAYSNILTTLHDEAIFLPITAKRQTAATNGAPTPHAPHTPHTPTPTRLHPRARTHAPAPTRLLSRARKPTPHR